LLGNVFVLSTGFVVGLGERLDVNNLHLVSRPAAACVHFVLTHLLLMFWKVSPQEAVTICNKLLREGLKRPELRDELYAQLSKQTRNNPNLRSNLKVRTTAVHVNEMTPSLDKNTPTNLSCFVVSVIGFHVERRSPVCAHLMGFPSANPFALLFKQAWELMHLVAATMPPSKDFVSYVSEYIHDCAHDPQQPPEVRTSSSQTKLQRLV
jgi:hypothetical protein